MPKNPKWISLGAGLGVYLYGLEKREETDAENALQRTTSLLHPERKLYLCEMELLVSEDGQVTDLPSPASFETILSSMDYGEALVQPEIAQIYHRQYLFEEVETDDQTLYFLRGKRKRPLRTRGLKPFHAPLVGRAKELEELTELLRQIREDQGQIAAIFGEPGIGKTRLLEALREEALSQKLPVLMGTFPIQSGEPYSAFKEIVRVLTGNEITTLTRWSMSDEESDFLRIFLEPNQKIERLSTLSEKEIQLGLFRSVRRLFHAAAQSPMVFILEDLHWADPASHDLLHFLSENWERTHGLLLLTHREGVTYPFQNALHFNAFPLQQLTHDDLLRYTQNFFDVDRVARHFQDYLQKRSLGNPLFLEEILRQLQLKNHIRMETSMEGTRVLRWDDAFEEESIPMTLFALLQMRLDALDAPTKEALLWASTFGSRFDVDEFLALGQSLNKDFPSAFDLLVKSGFLEEESVFPLKIHRFRHDMIYEVLRSGLVEKQKKQMFGVVGRFLESFYESHPEERSDRLARIFLQSDQTDKALAWSLRSARQNAKLFKIPEALDFYQKTLELSQKNPSYQTLRLEEIHPELADILSQMGDPSQILPHLKQWEAELQNLHSPLSQGLLHLYWSEYYDIVQTPKKGLWHSNYAIDSLRYFPLHKMEYFRARQIRCILLILDFQTTSALQEIHDLLNAIGTESSFQEIAFTTKTYLIYTLFANGQANEAQSLATELRRFLKPGHPPKLWIELLIREYKLFVELGDPKSAVESLNHAIQVGEKNSLFSLTARLRAKRASVLMNAGQISRSLDDLKEAIDYQKRIGNQSEVVEATLPLIDTWLDSGRADLARSLLNEIEPSVQENGVGFIRNYFRYLQAYTFEMESEFSKAVEEYNALIKENIEIPNQMWLARVYLHLLKVEILQRTQRPQELARIYGKVLKMIEGRNSPITENFTWAVGTLLCAKGQSVPRPEIDLSKILEIQPNWIRSHVVLARLRELRTMGKMDEFHKLKKDYDQLQEKLSLNVPPEARQTFLHHPIYSTLSLETTP